MINSVNGSIKERLLKKLKQIYDGRPWYGKSIKAILGMRDTPLPTEVLSLISHMIVWRSFTTAALSGREYKVELNTEQDWPPVILSSAEILADLEQSQVDLVAAITDFNSAHWHTKPTDAKYTYLDLCEGIIDHDIYHIAQVALNLKTK